MARLEVLLEPLVIGFQLRGDVAILRLGLLPC